MGRWWGEARLGGAGGACAGSDACAGAGAGLSLLSALPEPEHSTRKHLRVTTPGYIFHTKLMDCFLQNIYVNFKAHLLHSSQFIGNDLIENNK